MHLTSIKAENLQGERELTFAPTECTFVLGPNGSGKSARLNAIRLLLLGYLPELGKTGRATFNLSSGTELVVSGEFSNGAQASRSWKAHGNSVRSTDKLPEWWAEAQDKFAVLLNAAIYLNGTERERLEYVFANIPEIVGVKGPQELIESLSAALLKTEGIVAERVREFVADLVREVESNRSPGSPQAHLDRIAEHVAEELSRSRALAGVMTRTVQGLAYLRAENPIDEGATAALDAELAGVDEKIRTVSELRLLEGERIERAKATAARRETLLRELRAKGNDELAAGILRERIANARRKLDEYVSAGVSREAYEREEAVRRDLEAERKKGDALVRDLGNRIDDLRREIAETEAVTCCPLCKSDRLEWRAAKLSELRSALDGLSQRRAIEEEENRRRTREETRQTKKVVEELSEPLRERTKLEAEIGFDERNLATAEVRIAGYRAKHEELDRLEVPSPTSSAKFAELTAEQNAATDKRRELLVRRSSMTSRRAELKRLADAELAKTNAEADVAIRSFAVDFLREAKRGCVEAAMRPVLDTANELFGPRGPELHVDGTLPRLAYANEEIGYWNDGAWVPHRVFSASEKQLAYVALQTALATRAPFRIVVLDELSQLDDRRKVFALHRLQEAVKKGVIDQAIVADTRPPPEAISLDWVESCGWSIWTLNREAPVL